MNEFDLIGRYFRPLASGFAASQNLTDDAAILSVPAGHELVVTTDAIHEGIHFLGNESPDLIARKALRVNLSDLAAKGAAPLCYFLTLSVPKNTPESWFKAFATGLEQDQKEFSIHLAGGDTTATNGPLSISITALGTVPTGMSLKRSDAKIGDVIYVSGTLGDAALGLGCLRARQENGFLTDRYLIPQPRVVLGQKLLGLAHASMDISDGLVQDLAHICDASKLGATIRKNALPLSPDARKMLNVWEAALSGGDDYELLFTASKDKESAIATLSKELNLPLTAIGEIKEGSGVEVLDENGKPMVLAHKGYKHF